jgi:hypothetical protein
LSPSKPAFVPSGEYKETNAGLAKTGVCLLPPRAKLIARDYPPDCLA